MKNKKNGKFLKRMEKFVWEKKGKFLEKKLIKWKVRKTIGKDRRGKSEEISRASRLYIIEIYKIFLILTSLH